MKRENLFVYGTLKYEPYKSLLGDYVWIENTSVKGKLVLVEGIYPGFVEGRGKVVGELYEIDVNFFGALDAYEGDLYSRRKILTSTGKECWIYEYKPDIIQ